MALIRAIAGQHSSPELCLANNFFFLFSGVNIKAKSEYIYRLIKTLTNFKLMTLTPMVFEQGGEGTA